MTSVIATILDERYHFGLAVLVNSLFQNQYKGVVWAGYCGSLPSWASPLKEKEDYSELQVAPGCFVRFLSLPANQALAMFKPEFLLRVFERSAADISSLFYFDPDFVVDDCWSIYEEWVSLGIAIAADPYKSVPFTHPARLLWRKHYERHGLSVLNRHDAYVSDGFLGIPRQGLTFLHLWKEINELAVDFPSTTGGLGEQIDIQGSLNAAIEVTDLPFSLMGPYPSMIRPAEPLFYQNASMTKSWSGNRPSRGFVPWAGLRKGLAYTDGPLAIFPRVIGGLLQVLAGRFKQGKLKFNPSDLQEAKRDRQRGKR